ncbi:site-specific integrase [Clostridium botulinum]|nr:site-specific integrase [Clostridium botulinum]
MIIVKEEKGTLGTYYGIYLNEVKIKKVFIQRIKQALDKKEYVLLLNSHGIVIENVFKYINFSYYLNTINSKEVAGNALKILFSYSEIIDKEIKDFNKNDVQNLSEFILGISVTGNNSEFKLKTSRSNNTHNIYFNIIRKYLEYTGINNKNFFEKVEVSKSGIGFFAHTKEIALSKYKVNKSSFSIDKNIVPKYIKNEEYNNIINLLNKEKTLNSLRDKIIINLMYARGLRLGEVLGITFEDIKVNKDDSRAGILYIRNRVSDKKYQMAKTCYKPKSKAEYKTRIYNEKDFGYQTVILPPNITKDISDYRELSRDIENLSIKKTENILNESVADSVENENNNFYLFLNKNGAPLSSAGWNKRLKIIFDFIGINIDTQNKKNNLSHRFRHGFAMFLIKNEGKSIEYVQKQMRHKSISSTLIYYNPEEKDILKETLKISQNMRRRLE